MGDSDEEEKIIATVLHEAHKRQVEEVMDVLEEGSEDLYKRPLISPRLALRQGWPPDRALFRAPNTTGLNAVSLR